MAKKSVKNKMIQNFSLFGKITDRGKSIDKNESQEQTMCITQNSDANSLFNNTIAGSYQTVTGSAISEAIDFGFLGDAYLAKIATINHDKNKKNVLTRSPYYAFVEK